MRSIPLYPYLMLLSVCFLQKIQYAPEPQWWFSPEGAPLQFNSTQERNLDLFNTSKEVISSYTLGCVTETNNGFLLKKKFKEKTEQLKPNEGILSTKEGYRIFYNCKNPALKLTVVKVKFADGRDWILPLSKMRH